MSEALLLTTKNDEMRSYTAPDRGLILFRPGHGAQSGCVFLPPQTPGDNLLFADAGRSRNRSLRSARLRSGDEVPGQARTRRPRDHRGPESKPNPGCKL